MSAPYHLPEPATLFEQRLFATIYRLLRDDSRLATNYTANTLAIAAAELVERAVADGLYMDRDGCLAWPQVTLH